MNIKEFLIDENISILDAMKQLDKVSKKVLFVTKKSVFVASLTDGDIRRWLLKKGNLEVSVSNVANYKPKFLTVKDKHLAKNYMKQYFIECLPIVDDLGNIISIIVWNDEEYKKEYHLNVPVVIMAGGLGTRLYPYTKILPKPLIPFGETPILEVIINKFYGYGCQDFYLILNHKKNMIKSYFNELDSQYQLHYIDEDKPLGTGGGLSLLKGMIGTDFFLTNCDIVIDVDYESIYKHHVSSKNYITVVCSLKKHTIPYGVVEYNEIGDIVSVKEKPEHLYFVNTGMYVVNSKVITELESNVAIGFPTILEKYMKNGLKVGIYPIHENSWTDIGELNGLYSTVTPFCEGNINVKK